jgi:predicted nucleotidyltransferase
MRTIPGLNIDTQTVQERLANASAGEVVQYSELSALIGRDVQNGARGCLSSAMRRLLADGLVYASVRGEGVKRLSDEEIVGEGPAVIARVRRAASRAAKKLASVDFAALTPASQIKHNTALSFCGVLAHMTKASTVRKLEGRIEEAAHALPLQKTIEALKP